MAFTGKRSYTAKMKLTLHWKKIVFILRSITHVYFGQLMSVIIRELLYNSLTKVMSLPVYFRLINILALGEL